MLCQLRAIHHTAMGRMTSLWCITTPTLTRRQRYWHSSTDGCCRAGAYRCKYTLPVTYSHRNDYIGTEHLLLGRIHDIDDAVAQTLRALGLGPEAIRRQVEETIGPAQRAHPAHLPFTPQAKKALERSLHEAQLRGHDLVDAVHILCGLTRETESAAAKAFANLGVEPARIRQQVSLGWGPSAQ
jgi:ATP-dependent Clp protease ATP-binding subunit ClpA